MDEVQIEVLFPNGVVETRGKFRPRQEEDDEPTHSLKELLKAKKKRDQLDRDVYMRRVPPARPAKADDEVKPPTADEIEQAARESAYTSDPKAAIERVPVVPPHYQRKITAEAHERWEGTHEDQVFMNEMRIWTVKILRLQKEGAKYGLNFGPECQDLVKRIQAQLFDQRKAA